VQRAESDATRYLCAAAHLDRGFRDQVLDTYLSDQHRAWGSCFGVEVPTVVAHCLAARRHQRLRNAILLGISVVCLYFVITQGLTINLLPILLSGWIVVCIERWITRYKIVGQQLARGNFEIADHKDLLSSFSASILDEIDHQDTANLVVYSGFSPFVGSGYRLAGWSFTIDGGKGKEILGNILKPADIAVTAIYDHVASAIQTIPISHLSITDQLMVNGRSIKNDARFFDVANGRPRMRVTEDVMNQFIGRVDVQARHYKCIQVRSSEVILSIFFRVTKWGPKLYFETNYLLLPPINPDYKTSDRINPKPSWRTILAWILRAGTLALALLVVGPLDAALRLSRVLWRLLERVVAWYMTLENPDYDYGSKQSIREMAAAREYEEYFQIADRDMHVKILEKELLDSIIGYLDRANVDTSELREREISILNSGLFMVGGSVVAENLAVGTGASASVGPVKKFASRIKRRRAVALGR